MGMFDTRGVGFIELSKRTFKAFGDDDMSTYAAALAYRGLFALFPFLLFLIALLGFLHVPQFFDWLREQAAMALPGEAMDQVNPVIDQLQSDNGGVMSIGVLIALWTASVGVRSLINAMNKAYGVQEGRPVWKLYIVSLVYTLGIAIMLLAVAGLMILGPQVMQWLADQIGFGNLFVTIWTWVRWPAIVLLLMLIVAVINYFMPDVEQEFRFITPGAAVAVIVWIAASIGFGLYVRNFGNYDATYGSIGAIIILLFYFYISSAVLLLGVEMNAVIEHASVEGKNRGQKESTA
ncbi:YihY/virulence factor BrkB family protein [Halopseudomonas nanhaiensis]|uniref:YihY/virulence factor BrkB family protein n=1 Tax=Halopseudomonas nanhaiensis TaxID=2830842 RepID=UPI001CC079A3|nr:YihY/virulence factor BrkB family protein [Halopseudomonas nanhaiensis]UAW99926.1 YihY/virulence factor BrkB family protein [Halopseudomonas nanhaiensis]